MEAIDESYQPQVKDGVEVAEAGPNEDTISFRGMGRSAIQHLNIVCLSLELKE